MKIQDLLAVDTLDMMVRQGYVMYNTHPEFPELRIYCYTNQTVINQFWNPITMKCRGLIVNWDTKEVLARPFDKFFNYGEFAQSLQVQLYPDDNVLVYDKIDGSLGILYRRPDGHIAIATKGSFVSEQAIKATEMIRKYMTTHFREDERTWMFEIVYPQNRIVLDYGDFEGLVLLGARNIEEGDEWLPEELLDWKGRTATYYRFNTLRDVLEAAPRPNAEGYVAYVPDMLVRVKIKQADYLALHKIVTGLTRKRIWENIQEGKTLEDLLEIIPDEWHDWTKKTYYGLVDEFSAIKVKVSQVFVAVVSDLPLEYSRKDFAQKVMNYKYKGLLFQILDGKDINPAIWKMVMPRGDE